MIPLLGNREIPDYRLRFSLHEDKLGLDVRRNLGRLIGAFIPEQNIALVS